MPPIPACAGAAKAKLRKIAATRDEIIIAANAKQQPMAILGAAAVKQTSDVEMLE